jgi:hypothetical protein
MQLFAWVHRHFFLNSFYPICYTIIKTQPEIAKNTLISAVGEKHGFRCRDEAGRIFLSKGVFFL